MQYSGNLLSKLNESSGKKISGAYSKSDADRENTRAIRPRPKLPKGRA
jgi:hypothetical protein